MILKQKAHKYNLQKNNRKKCCKIFYVFPLKKTPFFQITHASMSGLAQVVKHQTYWMSSKGSPKYHPIDSISVPLYTKYPATECVCIMLYEYIPTWCSASQNMTKKTRKNI